MAIFKGVNPFEKKETTYEEIEADFKKLAHHLGIVKTKKKVVPYNYEGEDITSISMLAGTFSIKQRFENKDTLEQLLNNSNAMSLFIKSIYLLGYDKGLQDKSEL